MLENKLGCSTYTNTSEGKVLISVLTGHFEGGLSGCACQIVGVKKLQKLSRTACTIPQRKGVGKGVSDAVRWSDKHLF